MGAHADLLAAAAASATAAKESEGPVGRREHAEAAKVALEAAALAQNVGPGEIDQALGALQDELESAGLLVDSMELEPGEFLGLVLHTVTQWRREVVAVAAFETAYERLRVLNESLERDFIAGDTDTSRRIAGRIRTALEDADQILKNAADTGSAR